jgi:tetratricopeptide (TPR) repeat protein
MAALTHSVSVDSASSYPVGVFAATGMAALARSHSLPAKRYEDILSANTGHTAFVGNIPDSCATSEGVTALFKEHGITVLRAVVSDCPDEHSVDADDLSDDDDEEEEAPAEDSDDGDSSAFSVGDEDDGPHHWWGLVLFDGKGAAAKARNHPIVVDEGYGEEEVKLRVERVQLKDHLQASLELDEAWAAGSVEHNPLACRKSNLLAAAWREMCTVRVDHLSEEQAQEDRLHDAFGVCGELLEVSTHEPTERNDTGHWALLRFHHPESAGRAMTTDVKQSGSSDLHEDAHMHVLRPAGLWHSERWRKLNNHRKQTKSWGDLAYKSKHQMLSLEAQKRARSRSVSRMRSSTHSAGEATNDDDLHRLEDQQDDAIAYSDSELERTISKRINEEGYEPRQADEVFSVLRRRPPNSDERKLQGAVAGARGQPMYLCKLMNSGKYRWVSYHVLTHSVVAMGLVHEFEERLFFVERMEIEMQQEEAAAEEAAKAEAEASAIAQEVAAEAARQAEKLMAADRQREIEEAAPVVVGPRAALLIEIMRFGRPTPSHNVGETPKALWPDLDQPLDQVQEELEIQKGRGNILAAMELMELAIALQAVQFGVAADPWHCREEEGCVEQSAIVELVVAYNTAAVEALAPGQRARDTLWKAELLCAEPKLIARSKSQTKIRATTLNNLACCYRGMDQPHAALKYWKQTLGLQEGLGGSTLEFQRAGTHLNLAELYASTRYHHGSVRHAQTAVAYLLRRFELGPVTRPGVSASSPAGGRSGGAAEWGGRSAVGLGGDDIQSLKQQATTAPRRRKLALLVAAFDRLASSLRGLRRRAEASLATQTATALRAALMGTSAEQQQQQQQSLPQRPESLPALGGSDGSMQIQEASKAAASVESKRRHSSMGVLLREDAPPPSNSAAVRLPALQRHRFP